MADSKTFEEKMQELEVIVNELEQGNVPLEESITKFKDGMQLSEDLSKTLTTAEKTMAKIIDDSGKESAFETSGDDTTDNDQH
ncbi:exodeoxyribonuclease VII small subunit [Lentilactobacillus sp. SPB1-3]|uniref:Exodeoxyribonuclease VII small subunit n=1 Tax=Lentilactobacillus terminaliae TaxID=3003483 RepID=A0ACD5DBW0_9LACO|nr:exodeoxyribonuclease VII small subunit [Lentilactobacillus sp. SPB1-3]MCZ0977157.1 exodeoxyribonuclease VII small subunit [Lentilactobacillus sp. SPB1-3]